MVILIYFQNAGLCVIILFVLIVISLKISREEINAVNHETVIRRMRELMTPVKMALSRGASLWRTCSPLLQKQYCPLPVSRRVHSSVSSGLIPQTSLSRPPWPDQVTSIPEEEQRRRHAEVVNTVNQKIQQRDFGRLFAVVHFAGHQWKVTDEDLIMIENHIEAECGEQIRMEKVLLVGAEEFTLIGRPLLSKELVRVDATVIEKTESWPKVHMRFWKRHRFQRKKIIIQPQTVLRINSIQVAPRLT